jgi:hypothetical protein
MPELERIWSLDWQKAKEITVVLESLPLFRKSQSASGHFFAAMELCQRLGRARWLGIIECTRVASSRCTDAADPPIRHHSERPLSE